MYKQDTERVIHVSSKNWTKSQLRNLYYIYTINLPGNRYELRGKLEFSNSIVHVVGE